MLGDKTSLSQFRMTDIIQNIFPTHDGVKSEINNEENLDYPLMYGN